MHFRLSSLAMSVQRFTEKLRKPGKPNLSCFDRVQVPDLTVVVVALRSLPQRDVEGTPCVISGDVTGMSQQCAAGAGVAPLADAQALQDTPWSDEATCDGYAGLRVTSLAHRETLSLVQTQSR